jgi:hypothetical protein
MSSSKVILKTDWFTEVGGYGLWDNGHDISRFGILKLGLREGRGRVLRSEW